MITEITTIEADGKALLLSQFQNGSNIPEFLGVFLAEVQALETAAVQSIAKRWLMQATGWALEQIGELVGMPRPTGLTDDNQYRILILTQIAANISNGTLPELYNILRSMELTNVDIWEVYPASLTVNYTPNTLITPAQIREVLERATHPISFDITAIQDSTPFGFEGDFEGFGLDIGTLGDAA